MKKRVRQKEEGLRKKDKGRRNAEEEGKAEQMNSISCMNCTHANKDREEQRRQMKEECRSKEGEAG